MSQQEPSDRPVVPPDSLPKEAPAPRRELPPAQVVLHHDPALELMFVVRTIMELTRYCRAEATHKMWECFHRGRSVILTTYRERAEFMAEQFAEHGLRATVE
jgi:ATP-dependent Clp protease adapter protein ClpS